MPITEAEWDRLSWPERMNQAVRELKLHTGAALARRLGVTATAYYAWSTGKSYPTDIHDSMIHSICVKSNPMRTEQESTMAMQTIAVDSSFSMYYDILKSRDKMAISNAAHTIATKLAQLITKRPDISTVIRIGTIYGSYPVKENISIEVVGHPEVRYDIVVTHQPAGAMCFIMLLAGFVNDIQKINKAFCVSDVNLARECGQIISAIQTLCQKKQYKISPITLNPNLEKPIEKSSSAKRRYLKRRKKA